MYADSRFIVIGPTNFFSSRNLNENLNKRKIFVHAFWQQKLNFTYFQGGGVWMREGLHVAL